MIQRFRIGWSHIHPAIKLTTAYALIILCISVFFSLTIYRLSVDQLHDSLRRQSQRFQTMQMDGYPQPPPNSIRYDDELRKSVSQLRVELVYFNLIILVVGSGVSYWLAKRTLQPIEETLEAQRRFTADASHELRTPLTAMQTEIEVTLRAGNVTKAEALELLASNLEEVAKLRNLADGLLKLARSNEAAVALHPVSVEEVIAGSSLRLTKVAKARRITIASNVQPLQVVGEESMLTDLITIFIDNAIKYSSPGSTITVTVSRSGGQAKIAISDSGSGIKPEDIPHIFERFYRSDRSRSKEQIEGYGLGLSIAHQIIKLHNGSVEVKSRVGEGSTFTLLLPLARS